MHYQPELFRASLHCYCVGVVVVGGGGYGDVGVAAWEFAVFQ